MVLRRIRAVGITEVDGYFTDASMMRRVHRERTMALAGPQALRMLSGHLHA